MSTFVRSFVGHGSMLRPVHVSSRLVSRQTLRPRVMGRKQDVGRGLPPLPPSLQFPTAVKPKGHIADACWQWRSCAYADIRVSSTAHESMPLPASLQDNKSSPGHASAQKFFSGLRNCRKTLPNCNCKSWNLALWEQCRAPLLVLLSKTVYWVWAPGLKSAGLELKL